MTRVLVAHRFDLAQDHGERIVDGQHEHAAHDVDHADRAAVAGLRDVGAAPGTPAG